MTRYTEDQIVEEILQNAGEGYPADPDADDTYCLSARELENHIRRAVEMARDSSAPPLREIFKL